MAKTKAIYDNDKNSVNCQWEEIRGIYTTSNHQAITDFINRLSSLVFGEKKENREMFLSTFISIIDELGYYNQEISDKKEEQAPPHSAGIFQANIYGVQRHSNIIQQCC